ncbi:MAG: DUF4296 domain-containing protein [Bacteroidia bacterium]|nr:DUF4296 domain-containing protein [Bacteroidota bacterium]MBP6512424.1 DUF4296 domain-containing protein [Bacteroidia bacterium]MBP7244888.1 DUF4296 domain-containing protein [Bacteroidia bacterium]
MKKIGIVLMLSLFFGCSKKQVEVPADVIPRDTMIVVLAEIHLAEASIQVLNVEVKDSLKAVSFGFYNYIFSKHNITQELFKKSFDYYRSEPAYFHAMYDEVITRLSEDQAKYSSLPLTPPRIERAVKDSVVKPMPVK